MDLGPWKKGHLHGHVYETVLNYGTQVQLMNVEFRMTHELFLHIIEVGIEGL